MNIEQRRRAAIYGLLIGDAVGVPYEFKALHQLPAIEKIDMQPPHNFARSYASIAVGTWSDDGAQALCLLSSLLDSQQLNTEDFMRRICAWYQQGYMAVDGHVFDVGIQTVEAIHRYQSGIALDQVAQNHERANGNGALMRVLPLALWHQGSDETLIADAYAQSHITHAHLRSKICCALYCLWAREVLQGAQISTGWLNAVARFQRLASPKELDELEQHILNSQWQQPTGSGYVVDCLKSAYYALQSNSYQSTIQRAIALGQDTDTTACVAGGIAGLFYGLEGIPQPWLQALRGRELVEQLLTQWKSQS